MLARIIISLIAVLMSLSTQAVTYYYKIEKIVTNGNQSPASGSGIFITFTKQGCYDSDAQGYANNKSNLRFVYENNYKVYNGSTYWGSGDYKFNSDLSRLNIVVGDKVYVYQRTQKPAGVSSSSYIGPEASSSAGGYYVPDYSPASGSSLNDGMSAEWYQSTYNRYALNAESIYNSITTTINDGNGNYTSGYVYKPEDSQVAITGMKRNLRNVQRDMRDLRQEAMRKGYNIVKSPYEDISVKTL